MPKKEGPSDSKKNAKWACTIGLLFLFTDVLIIINGDVSSNIHIFIGLAVIGVLILLWGVSRIVKIQREYQSLRGDDDLPVYHAETPEQDIIDIKETGNQEKSDFD